MAPTRIPSRKALFSELDTLGFGARLARVARLGRDGQGQPALKKLMDELLAGDAYEAGLGLELARGAQESTVLLRGLTHPSGLVRGRAAAFAADGIPDDDALERILPEVAPFVRRRILKGVARTRRSALAARLLPSVLARHGAEEAALLLSALDAETVRRHLPALEYAVHGWRTLVLHHPDAVLELLRARLTAAPERLRASLFQSYSSALTHLTLRRAEAVLALVRELCPPDTIPSFLRAASRRLTRHHPEAFTELLLRPGWRAALRSQGLPRGMLREAPSLTQAQRLALARALAEVPAHLTPLLEALPPSQRSALFAHAFEGTEPHLLPDALLTVLPHATRDAEAARQLGLREVREDRDQQLVLQSLRTIENGRDALQKAATASKAEDRARALALLVTCTGLSRRGLTETLAALGRLKNEQDPVRLAALSALARVPPSVFTSEHIPALQAQVTHVVEARDTSRGTQMALQELAFRQMRAHATDPEHPLFRFALETLKRLAGQSGALVLPPLERDLPRGAEHHLVAALLPMIRAATQRESPHLIFTLTRALGRRAWNVDMLQALLEPHTVGKPDTVAHTAIALWLAPPRTRDVRVRKLLDQDESHITLPSVFAHVHQRRQEWLDPFLQGRPLHGRYSTGKTGWIPPAYEGFFRWLPRQQRRFAELLMHIARDTTRSAWERMSVVGRLARLPVTTLDDLSSFRDAPDVPTVEAMLGAIPWLDMPEAGLPLLLENLDGDRARVAMYAVPRVARRSSPERFAAALGALLSREKLKVTVHKEVLRLLGAFRFPHAVTLLRQQWDRPQLHRDVRIAVGHAARQLLDDPAAWELLEAMARSTDEYVPASLLDQGTAQLPVQVRPRYARLILQVTHHPDLDVRRRALSVLPPWSASVEEEVARELGARVREPSTGAEWREAVQTLVEVTREGIAFDEVVECASRLVSAPATPDATPERDVPARQRLQGLCRALLGWPPGVRLRLRSRLQEVGRVVARDASLWPEAAALRLAGLDWEAPRMAQAELLALGEEVREEPLFAPVLAATVASAVAAIPVTDAAARPSEPEPEGARTAGPPPAEAAKTHDAGWTPETLLALADGVSAELPLVAVALVSAAGRHLHWREDAARRLRVLRQHPRAAVRAAAFATVTASE